MAKSLNSDERIVKSERHHVVHLHPLSYVGTPLKVVSIIALIIGICFLGHGVVQDLK